MRYMAASLSKASRVFPDCAAMITKLRAMTVNAEELVQSQKNQATRLIHLTARTTPKGLHCLSMRLTAEYFALQPEERQFPNQKRLQDTELYHYAVFSDNVLACAVVVNSTISTAMVHSLLNFFCTMILLVLIYLSIICGISKRKQKLSWSYQIFGLNTCAHQWLKCSIAVDVPCAYSNIVKLWIWIKLPWMAVKNLPTLTYF